MYRILAVAASIAILAIASIPASAQTAAPAAPAAAPATPAAAPAAKKKKAKAAPAKFATELVVENKRAAAASQLLVAGPDGKEVASLKAPLAPGKKITLKLPKKTPCELSVLVGFADDGELEGSINACTDKTLKLND